MGQWLMVPMLVIMFIVYQLIIWFISWYIHSEIGTFGFLKTILIFILGIILYVGGSSLILVYGWEYIGLMSFLLISFWQRGEAIRSSVSAVIYNRLGDFGILLFCYALESWILGMLAVLRKSALWIIGYWLPIAMEGPTPVSSLLHSSTIVVARVILSMMLGRSLVLGLTAILMMSAFLPTWFDGKKMIALSTSVHLVIIFLAVSSRMYGLCIIHILTHAFVKASCFVSSRIKIGITGTQEIRHWSLDNQVVVMILSFLLLCGVGRSIIFSSKEMIVLQFFFTVIVLIGWKYTKTFLNRIRRISSNIIKISYSLVMIMVLGRSGFGGVELVSILVIIRGLIPLFNSWSGYVVNK